MTAILGISAFYHDSAAALIVDGNIVAAAQEERFTRKKHDKSFPVRAINYCLAETSLTADQLDYVGFYDKPILKFDRLLETYAAYAPVGFKSFLNAMPSWLKQKLHLPRDMRRALGGTYKKRFVFTEHHESHAASAFFPSPFQEAAILTMDGVGEWATASYGVGRGNELELTHELRFPHSVGLLYSAFTYYCGFQVNDGEYKLMGLAPYGEPIYADLIMDNLLDLKEDGSLRLDMSFFNYCQGLTMTSEKFEILFGGPPRKPDTQLMKRDMDLAASIQHVTEEIMLCAARHLHKITSLKNLCLAGGVALNCVANGRILREGPFDGVWIQPAADDAGGALGVALFIWYQLLGNERTADEKDHQHGSLLGASYSDEQIGTFLDSVGASYQRLVCSEQLLDTAVAAIADGLVVGWFQGRMEFGPRALGSRSILGDARDPTMQAKINLKVKYREGFRPFAPVVLLEHAHKYFDLCQDIESPYMQFVASVRDEFRVKLSEEQSGAQGIAKLSQKRSTIPATTHVDYSARIQTVDRLQNRLFRGLLEKFYAETGCPILVNTSFNLGWDPIVCSPRDAYETFMASGIDVLCMGQYVLRKDEQRATSKVISGSISNEILEGQLISPCCQAELDKIDESLTCSVCGHIFPIFEDIPQLFWPQDTTITAHDVTNVVKAFYEKTPFPNYDDLDSVRSLIEKSRLGIYGQRLNDAIPHNTRVLEIGCGTGQLSNYLGVSCRQVIGVDMCLNSLRLGEAFRKKFGLNRVRFLQMNLFQPCLKPGQFDTILCNGVLHHTSDPYSGFVSLLPLLKPRGHIVIGLYNRYGRLLTDLRRQIIRLTGGRAKWVDPILRRGDLSKEKRRSWFADQYCHPHESKHTFGEVLDWFDSKDIEFIRSIPAMRLDDDGLEGGTLFEQQPRGGKLDRILAEWSQIFAHGQREGGFFIMIGQKRALTRK